MPATPTVDVVGLRAFMRDVAKLSDDQSGPIVRRMTDAAQIALGPVMEAARAALPKSSGTLAGDLRLTKGRTGGGVRMGRAKVPYAGWVEFGGTRHRPHESDRDYVKDGRYLFPAARGLAERTARLYSDAVQKAFDGFNWTNPSDGSPEQVHD